MMNYIWAGMIFFSFVCAAFGGKMHELSQAVISAGNSAVELALKLLGMLCIWSGMMKIAERSGLTDALGRCMYPLLRLIFPSLERDSEAAGAISMNLTANIMGLGNAATPLGINAMRILQKENPSPLCASDNMIFFVVMNTAAMHIIPTTVALLRSQYGSSAPMDIMPAAWLNSALALFAGLLAAKAFAGFSGRKGRAK